MGKRLISGTCFVAMVVGFFLLREYVDARLFQILTWIFCAIGTFEVARAVKDYSVKKNVIICTVFGVLFPAFYALMRYLVYPKFAYLLSIDFILLALIIVAIFTAIEKKDIKTFGVSALPIVYPSLFILVMLLANDLAAPKGFIAMLLIFVISPISDTMAYLVGMTYNNIRKGKAKKMCPKLSPKKTWAGAIGGVIGGVIGAVLTYAIFNPVLNIPYPYLVFAAMGVIAGVLTELGDLFESLIKRKVGIKDMGDIMPGHGGVMDRIDGICFAAVLIFFVFLFI